MTVLRRRMTEDMQARNLSPHTQASYLRQVSPFARYFRTSPELLTPEHIRNYQIYLTNEQKLATNSIHTAVAALRFPLQGYAQKGMELWRRYPASQEATEAARASPPPPVLAHRDQQGLRNIQPAGPVAASGSR